MGLALGLSNPTLFRHTPVNFFCRIFKFNKTREEQAETLFEFEGRFFFWEQLGVE
jgi:hypothetical protein